MEMDEPLDIVCTHVPQYSVAVPANFQDLVDSLRDACNRVSLIIKEINPKYRKDVGDLMVAGDYLVAGIYNAN